MIESLLTFPKDYEIVKKKKEEEEKKKPCQFKDFIHFKEIFSIRNIDDILFLMALKLNPS